MRVVPAAGVLAVAAMLTPVTTVSPAASAGARWDDGAVWSGTATRIGQLAHQQQWLSTDNKGKGGSVARSHWADGVPSTVERSATSGDPPFEAGP